ncbi:hypothetical protein IAE35_23895 [Pseudomonas sp. S75]|uniref:hypothetical protein n=1 Tax=unclassified Pseudomonas TaxID=196821 RepID=UPI0019086A2D|nr:MULTISPECIES: hypothetical protein [unclassified Pseudomonas]MBJ9978434.1 hypothetical protein [Pseudomonas sp. S30]MBK0156389.1 hypothetical protein [Pseudomonas sp. S75]
MDADNDFDPFTDEVPYLRIDRLKNLQVRAKNLVRLRSEIQLREASSTIEWLTSEYFYIEKESWIRHQLETGGSVLRFLRYEDRTERGLRELIDHHCGCDIHPSELDFSTEENTRPLEALEEALKGFNLDDHDFPDAKPYEYVAVLALMLIGQAVRSHQADDWPRFLRDDLPMMRLSAIANDAVDIMEAVCRAEQWKDQHEVSKRAMFLLQLNEKELPEKVEELARKKVSLSASLAASARHKETSESKLKALSCWDATGGNFSSRAAFARTKHKEYGVTERTLYGWIASHERSRT